MNWIKVVEVLLKILTFGLSTWKACKEEEQKESNNKDLSNEEFVSSTAQTLEYLEDLDKHYPILRRVDELEHVELKEEKEDE